VELIKANLSFKFHNYRQMWPLTLLAPTLVLMHLGIERKMTSPDSERTGSTIHESFRYHAPHLNKELGCAGAEGLLRSLAEPRQICRLLQQCKHKDLVFHVHIVTQRLQWLERERII
jgi:hypothetical protein